MDGTNGTSPGYPDPDPWRDLPPLSGPCGRTDPRGPTRSLPDYNPTLINKTWLISVVEIEIRIIILLIIIRDIGTDKYITAIYAIFTIYFPGKDFNSLDVYAYITREAYIVEGLKIKIFIKINIFGFKFIDISISKNNLYIGLYYIDVSIISRTRFINSI